MDHLSTKLGDRFTPHHQSALKGMYLIPSVLVDMPTQDVEQKIDELAKMYANDLPSVISVDAELHSWCVKWQQQLKQHGKACLPTNLAQSLSHTTAMFPNICAIKVHHD